MKKSLIFLVVGIGIAIAYFNPFYSSNTIDISETEVATFSGGCFWCSEADFEKHHGVLEAVSGFAGGIEKNPNYKDVARGKTRHREAVQVYYDPAIISYKELLKVFWTHINPTDVGGQFVDRGFQYSSAIFYHNDTQKTLAETSKEFLNDSPKFEGNIVTPILAFTSFYPAEEYHQDYHKKNALRYKYYRAGSGRDDYIQEVWKSFDFGDGYSLDHLSPLQYYVTQEDGTEKPFENEYWDNESAGIYVDIVSGEPLFSSTHKYKSGTGWPSFDRPLVPTNIVEKDDYFLLYPRTEVRSLSADSHLGHVFTDGPKETTGLRYCINSAALRFVPVEQLEEEGYEEFLELFTDEK